MVRLDCIENEQHFWYVYLSTDRKSVELLEVIASDDFQNELQLEVLEHDASGSKYPIVRISYDLENGVVKNLFQISDRKKAEKVWLQHFITRFHNANGIEFTNFIKIYKEALITNPEFFI